MSHTSYIIDFDSTFTKVEALDVLCDIVYAEDDEKRAKIRGQIEKITQRAMAGDLSFAESLKQRIDLIRPQEKDIEALVELLKEKVSDSFRRNESFIRKNSSDIYIVSNGFKAFIEPIVREYGIEPEKVFANTFRTNNKGEIIGFDEENVLARNLGKAEQIKSLALKGEILVIGDGYTDYETKLVGIADKFYAFTENVHRESVTSQADHIVPNLDDFLFERKLERSHSYPKNRIKILILENIHERAVKSLTSEGFHVVTDPRALSEAELIEAIAEVSILCIRSKTQITKEVLAHAPRLLAIGAFCIGTNQIDLDTCTSKGIAVFNAPYANTRSVVELAMAEMVLLMRNIPDKTRDMHLGKWNKSAWGSYEIRGKTLGIIGYGNIGAQLSILAESLGMYVIFFDLEEKLALGNARPVDSMQTLLQKSHVVSLHVDGRPENEKLIDAHALSQMKTGSLLINLSRGHVIDLEALKVALDDGLLGGAAVDVFPKEPHVNSEPFASVLRGAPNTILTPHIGGSTLEAQESIADFVPGKLMNYINNGSTTQSVNFPDLSVPALRNAHRFIHVHANRPGVLANINRILAEHTINVIGQYLKTNEQIGYVISDIDKDYPEAVIKDLKRLDGTLRFRVLY